jgi:hypothetical protein
MIELKERINAFAELAVFLKQFGPNTAQNKNLKRLNELYYENFSNLIKTSHHYNGWFTEENVRCSLRSIADSIEKKTLESWISPYSDEIAKRKSHKIIGVIMAGNIPAVGFHDFLCVLMSGNIFLGKTSSDDRYLLPAIANVLIEIEPEFKNLISFTEGRLNTMDAVIATGSNNSSRYFEYYFGKYPHIIRKNRNSVAVLQGNESQEDLGNFGRDIFQYFGLGCRNVSKIFVPSGYDFDHLFKAFYSYKEVVNNNKYGNNYDYNKTVYLMNNTPLLENGFLLLKEDAKLASPVAVLHYEYYTNEKELFARLKTEAPNIQCIISNNKEIKGAIAFGESQKPGLSDYADGIDTMKFMNSLG